MQIRFSHILSVGALLLSLGGCIKSDNNITGLDIKNPGIGFPNAANTKNDVIIRPATTAQQIPGLLIVTLEAAAAASSDIHVALADNSTAMVNAFNAANGTFIQALPRTLWSIPSELIINAGDRFAMTDITINNTSGINLNQQYAIGITITGASGGIKIADNLKNLFIVFRIQNALDGKYKMNGESYHPSIAPNFIRHNVNVELHTIGPNSVIVYWPVTGYYLPVFDISGNPIPVGVGFPFPNMNLGYILNTPANTINCFNADPGGIIVFQQLNSYNNRWDTASGTIYSAFGYILGAGNIFIPGTSRAWIDTLTYLGPR